MTRLVDLDDHESLGRLAAFLEPILRLRGRVDSTENSGQRLGVHSLEPGGDFEADGDVLISTGAGGSRWGGVPSGGGSTLDDVITATGPDAFWKFNEASGTTAFDSSGNGYDLTAGSATAPTWGQAAGPPGQPTAKFSNTASVHPYQVSRTATTPDWPAGGDFSVFGWAKFDGSTTGQFMIVGQGASLTQNGTAGWSIGFSSQSGSSPNYQRYIEIWCDNGSPPTPTVRGDNLLTAGTWYWIGFVRSGGVFTMYVNNLAQSTTSSQPCVVGSSKIQFGYSDAIPAISFFNGYASYWGVWAKALSAAEMTRLYEFALAAGIAPADYVLTADGTGGTEWDLVRNANVATNAALTVSKLAGDGAKALGSVAGVPTWLTLAGDVSGALTALAIGAKKVLATMIGSGASAADTVLQADGSGGATFVARIKTLCKFGSTPLTGAVTLTGGSNVTLTQAGQDITIAATVVGSGAVDSIAKSGSSPLTGAVTLTGGTGVTLTQAGNDISFAAAAGYAVICDLTLGSDQASFDTNTILGGNIPSTYKHLRLEMSLRSDRAATTDNAMLVLNNDTTNANYNSQRISAINATTTATQFIGTITGIILGTTVGGTGPSNSFAPFVVDLPDYLSSANLKMALSESSNYFASGSGGLDRQVISGVWLGTPAAVTRIRVAPLTGTNWKTNSRFTLYGLP